MIPIVYGFILFWAKKSLLVEKKRSKVRCVNANNERKVRVSPELSNRIFQTLNRHSSCHCERLILHAPQFILTTEGRTVVISVTGHSIGR